MQIGLTLSSIWLITYFGVDVYYVNHFGRTALHEAAAGGAIHCVDFLLNPLLAHVMNVNITDSFGLTPIIEACRHGRIDVYQRLLERGGNVCQVDQVGQSALHCAVKGGHVDVVDALLLTNPFSIYSRDNRGWTPLHCAAAAGNVVVVEKLVREGANTDIKTNSSDTALQLAIECGHDEVVDSLRNHQDLESDFTAVSLEDYTVRLDEIEFNPDGDTWLGAPVEIEVRQPGSTNILYELHRWSKLRHPNVVQFYGFCRGENGKAYFVCEPDQGSLLEHFSQGFTPSILWQRIFEAAAALAYLHNRNVVHAGICCDSIVIAGDGVAKLRNLGNAITEDQILGWTAPEVLSGFPFSFESDVYAFGITIVEAFTRLGFHWEFNPTVLDDAIRAGKIPDRPTQMTTSQWQLIEQMCCYHPQDRLSASGIVRKLEILLNDNVTLSSIPTPGGLFSWDNIEDISVADKSVSKLLSESKLKCVEGSTTLHAMLYDVYERLVDILELLKARQETLSGDVVHRFLVILLYFHRQMLKFDFSIPDRVPLFNSILQATEITFSIHGDLDIFMDAIVLSRLSNVHCWQQRWGKELLSLLDNSSSFSHRDQEQEESLAYIYNAMDKRLKSYFLCNTSTKDIISQAESWFVSAKVSNPNWFISPCDVTFDEFDEFDSGAASWFRMGKWKHVQVQVQNVSISSDLTECTQIKTNNISMDFVDTYYKLHHPHILKLFGACHTSESFLVYESTREQLALYLIDHPDEIWDKLYEACLGLRYLHSKHIVHGGLTGTHILIGCDGNVKLALVPIHQQESLDPDKHKIYPTQDIQWRAPEVLRDENAMLASDVYSFGMCILQLLTPTKKLPWGKLNDGKIKDIVLKEMRIPERPDDCSKEVYDLVTNMCCFDPYDRISSSEIVRRLEAFTMNYRTRLSDDAEQNVIPVRWSEIGVCKVSGGTTTISSYLAEIDELCENTVTCVDRCLYDRFVDVFSQLNSRKDMPSQNLFQRFGDMLYNFRKEIEESKSVSFQKKDQFLSLQNELDIFMDPTRIKSNQWVYQSESRHQDLLTNSLLQSASELYCGGLSMDLSANFSTSAAHDTTNHACVVPPLAVSKSAPWFIPEYEDIFDDVNEFSRGAFGKVHHGKWRRADVVVKTVMLRTSEEQAAFLNEVKIWHTLHHPHVVRLFGACHIVRPFFVCENAKGGQLDHYLKKFPRETWNKLYETALGIQYLHGVGVVHGDLKCNNILIGSDGLAKLTDFGLSHVIPITLGSNEKHKEKVQTSNSPGAIRWKAPEVLRGEKMTFASDVYGFGMCILEATSGAYPWGQLDDNTVKFHVLTRHNIPKCPKNCSDTMYLLVQRMCCFDPQDRLSISDVVQRLQIFTQNSEIMDESAIDLASLDEMANVWVNIEDARVVVSSNVSTILRLLLDIGDLCSGSFIITPLNRVVYSRLYDVFDQLKSQPTTLTKEVIRQYGTIVRYFYVQLEKTRELASQVIPVAACRQGVDSTFTVHRDLDLLMNAAHLSNSRNIHKWRSQWELLCSQQQCELLDRLKNLPVLLNELDDVNSREAILEVLRFEQRTNLRGITGFTHRSAKGTWLGAPIEIKIKKTWQSKTFAEEVRQWPALSHPHVVKMYGFCCGDEVQDPFFVYERPTYSSLFEYLKMNRMKLWDKLYEAAMGLEYLHDRDIVHGDISCISIAVAANGLAKLKNLRSHNDENSFRHNPTWTSPELLAGSPPTYQSDVYMFGLTIVQAFKTAGDLWDIFGGVRDETIRSGKLPLKPAEMTSTQWQLIQKMCSFEPNNRLSASDVVRELEIFTHESQRFFSTLEDKDILHHWANLGEYKILDTITAVKTKEVTVESILADIERIGTANDMIRDVYKRLMNIFNQLTTKTEKPHVDLVDRYTSILTIFLNRLENMNSFKLPQAADIVRIRQVADICFSAHGHIAMFVNSIKLTNLPNWRNQWKLHRREQISEIMKKFENVSDLFKDVESEKEREEAMTYLRFELANHASSYILATVNNFTRSKAAVAAFATSKNVEWFIPAYEVEFNALDQFNSGSFGSVHRGKWKHAQVVVKKLNLMTETSSEGNDSLFDLSCDENPSLNPSRDGLEADFLNEVKIWHKLYHPNVVQLFGACHIGNPIFVCEYAGGGQLDEYLRIHPKEILQKLYEAALGLRYLHEKQVVHKNLKCNNILIGNDGVAKLANIGLSTLLANPVLNKEESKSESEKSEKQNVGAIRWRAPEVLQRNSATFASDVYSFGMCILEAASGTFPWGKTPDSSVKDYVMKQKRIPQCPDNCSQGLYELVKRMCQFDASDRIVITEVIDVLLEELRSCESNWANLETNVEIVVDTVEITSNTIPNKTVNGQLNPNDVHFDPGFSKINSLLNTPTPKWFIPEYEVEFDKYNRIGAGGFSTVHLGTWMHSKVAVKKVRKDFSVSGLKDYERKSYLHEVKCLINEVEIWQALRHPYVVQLFGACHIGTLFFVCQYAGGGQLDIYVRDHQDKIWEKLYEAALGLQYLHERGVVHSDLKCNNILIGSNGTAMLADFGLSTMKSKLRKKSNNNVYHGAIRWKAPEAIKGDDPSFASDIYSFGMCILEAVSGEFPWGREIPDAAVKFLVTKVKKIPPRPSACSEEAYELVKRICRYEPSERIKINEVVDALKTLR